MRGKNSGRGEIGFFREFFFGGGALSLPFPEVLLGTGALGVGQLPAIQPVSSYEDWLMESLEWGVLMAGTVWLLCLDSALDECSCSQSLPVFQFPVNFLEDSGLWDEIFPLCSALPSSISDTEFGIGAQFAIVFCLCLLLLTDYLCSPAH